MTPNEIRSKLIEKGIKQNQLAKEIHVTPPLISLVINRRTKSRRAQKIIASKLGLSYSKVWPESKPINPKGGN